VVRMALRDFAARRSAEHARGSDCQS
jgi:hypothetical protein